MSQANKVRSVHCDITAHKQHHQVFNCHCLASIWRIATPFATWKWSKSRIHFEVSKGAVVPGVSLVWSISHRSDESVISLKAAVKPDLSESDYDRRPWKIRACKIFGSLINSEHALQANACLSRMRPCFYCSLLLKMRVEQNADGKTDSG